MNNIKSILKILKYFSNYARWIFIFAFLTIASAIFDGSSIALIIPAIQGIFASGSTGENNAALNLISSLFAGFTPILRLQLVALAILCCVLLKNFLIWISNAMNRWLTYRIRWEVVSEVFQQALEVEYSYIASRKSGELYGWLELESARISAAFYFILQLISVSTVIVIYVITMVILSWRMTLLVALPLSALFLAAERINRMLRRLGERTTEISSRIFSYWIEIIAGMRTVRTFRNYDFEVKRHGQLWRDWNRLVLKKHILIDLLRPGTETLIALFAVAAAIIFARLIISNNIGLLSLSLVFAYMLKLLQIYITNFNTTWASLIAELPSFSVIEEVLRRDNKVYIRGGDKRFFGLKEGILLKGLVFRYPKNNHYALKGVTLYIPKGKTTALVGSSGSGKSTLADLIFRLYDPSEGEILVDGEGLKGLNLADWQSRIGFVSQDTFIFNASAGDNIAYGKLGASREEVIQAAKKAGAHEFIMNLPHGYETILGDRGFKISGGERQRVALARVILRSADILIFDEATSALDSESEHLIQKSIQELEGHKTIIMIAHRLSTVIVADKLAVIEQGRIVEEGNHIDLMNKKGIYERYHRLQYRDNAERGAV
jgi:subfamily B ATP-binding cassette protein MsbA